MPRQPTITLKAIAERAGVSSMTVSAALSGKSGNVLISEATRRRVLDLAQEMGYRPNVAARTLVTGRTNQIAFWTQGVSNPYFNAVYHLARRDLRHYGLGVTLLEAGGRSPSQPLANVDSAVDGVVVFDWPNGEAALRETLATLGLAHLPFVGMGCYYVAGEADYVGVDLAAGTRQAVEHLYTIGCQRIAYVVDQGSHYETDARWSAYTLAVQRAGLEPEYIVTSVASRASARSLVTEYFGSYRDDKPRPDGLFCHNDVIASGVYRGLCDLGIRVPQDVALVGCDGIEDIEYLERPLSTLRQPAEQMCALACQFLYQRIQNASLSPQQIVLCPELIVRESSSRELDKYQDISQRS